MLSFWNDEVTIVHPSTTTERGSELLDWTNATRTVVPNCSMQPAATALSTDGRVLGISDGYTCYMPITAPVLSGDRIEYNGKQYTITGEPRAWPSVSGRLEHYILNLEAYSG